MLFYKIVFFSLIRSLLDFAGPFLINHIIDYVQNPNRTVLNGVYIVLALILARVILSLFVARLRTFFVKILKGKNLLIKIIQVSMGDQISECCKWSDL